MLGKTSECSIGYALSMAHIIGLMTREFHGTGETAASWGISA
jgi:hypothetical protein